MFFYSKWSHNRKIPLNFNDYLLGNLSYIKKEILSKRWFGKWVSEKKFTIGRILSIDIKGRRWRIIECLLQEVGVLRLSKKLYGI